MAKLQYISQKEKQKKATKLLNCLMMREMERGEVLHKLVLEILEQCQMKNDLRNERDKDIIEKCLSKI